MKKDKHRLAAALLSCCVVMTSVFIHPGVVFAKDKNNEDDRSIKPLPIETYSKKSLYDAIGSDNSGKIYENTVNKGIKELYFMQQFNQKSPGSTMTYVTLGYSATVEGSNGKKAYYEVNTNQLGHKLNGQGSDDAELVDGFYYQITTFDLQMFADVNNEPFIGSEEFTITIHPIMTYASFGENKGSLENGIQNRALHVSGKVYHFNDESDARAFKNLTSWSSTTNNKITNWEDGWSGTLSTNRHTITYDTTNWTSVNKEAAYSVFELGKSQSGKMYIGNNKSSDKVDSFNETHTRKITKGIKEIYPKKDGYKWTGKWEDKNNHVVYAQDEKVAPEKDITLVPKAEPINITINFHANTKKEISYNYEKHGYAPSNTENKNYKFLCWKLNYNAQNAYVSAKDKSGTVHYIEVSSELEEVDGMYAFKSKEITKQEYDKVSDKHTDIVWNANDELGTSFIKHTHVDFSGDAYPVLVPNDYKIETINTGNEGEVVANGCFYEKYGVHYTNEKDSSLYGTGVSGIIKVSVPSLTGYTFGGYYTSMYGTGTKMIDKNGNFIASKMTPTRFTCDSSLYAYWDTRKFKVVFDAGTSSTNKITPGSSHTYTEYGQPFTAYERKSANSSIANANHLISPTKVGYTFKGFYYDVDGNGSYDKGKDIMVYNDSMSPLISLSNQGQAKAVIDVIKKWLQQSEDVPIKLKAYYVDDIAPEGNLYTDCEWTNEGTIKFWAKDTGSGLDYATVTVKNSKTTFIDNQKVYFTQKSGDSLITAGRVFDYSNLYRKSEGSRDENLSKWIIRKEGIVQLIVTLYDKAGNSAVISSHFYIDTQAPYHSGHQTKDAVMINPGESDCGITYNNGYVIISNKNRFFVTDYQ